MLDLARGPNGGGRERRGLDLADVDLSCQPAYWRPQIRMSTCTADFLSLSIRSQRIGHFMIVHRNAVDDIGRQTNAAKPLSALGPAFAATRSPTWRPSEGGYSDGSTGKQ
jgi:hypothetical protein